MTATKLCQAIYTNLHSFPNAKQHRAWIVLGCETVFIFDDDDRAVISATEISNDFEVVVKLSKSLAICQKTAEALNLLGFFSKPKSKSTETKTTLTFFGSKENRFGRKTSNKLWWLQHFLNTPLVPEKCQPMELFVDTKLSKLFKNLGQAQPRGGKGASLSATQGLNLCAK